MGGGHIHIGISSCLLGEPVRYDGGHRQDRYITDVLSEHFTFVPYCPEVAIGLGIPRATIRLQRIGDSTRAIQSGARQRDVTAALAEYGRRVAAQAAGISGYIFKSRSPSCGMARVRIYDNSGNRGKSGRGVYTAAFMAGQPLLPAEEEGRLNDPDLRDNFIERVMVFHRWQQLSEDGLTADALVRFHSEHKFLIMAHSGAALRELGRMVANLKKDHRRIAGRYITRLMAALSRPAQRGARANALQHVAGFFKNRLDAGDRRELLQGIEAYRNDEQPIIVPLTLIRHHMRRHPHDYLEGQAFLEQRPKALDTRRR